MSNHTIKELDALIEYESAMLEGAEKYPTDSVQFYSVMDRSRPAMDRSRQRIADLKKEREDLIKSAPKEQKESK